MQVLLGGTFSVLHKAHKLMISRGLEMGELTIGLTSDNFRFQKSYGVPNYESRKKNLETFLSETGKHADIKELRDPVGGTLAPEYDAIVSSNETLGFISNINLVRKANGIPPLLVENVGTVLAEDLMPIKSERILKGIIDEEGKRVKGIEIVLATKNEEKVKGAYLFFNRIFKDFRIKTVEVRNEFISQPINSEIFEGALRRVDGIEKGYDYAIGIEAGVVSMFGHYYDLHVAAVKDSLEEVDYGMSSSLPLNDSMMRSLKMGQDLEQITNDLVGVNNSGKDKGAIYYLSKGLKERKNLVEESLVSAFTKRIGNSIPGRII